MVAAQAIQLASECAMGELGTLLSHHKLLNVLKRVINSREDVLQPVVVAPDCPRDRIRNRPFL